MSCSEWSVLLAGVTVQDYLLGDATKANTKLGWKPKYDFQVCVFHCYVTTAILVTEYQLTDHCFRLLGTS